jgi:hypothetical protein
MIRLRDPLNRDQDSQLLLVTCVLLSLSILTIAGISSTSLYLEEGNPYQLQETDIVLAEYQISFHETLQHSFETSNFSAISDEKAHIHSLFNETRDIFYTVSVGYAEHLYLTLQSVNETSDGHYRLNIYFSLEYRLESVSVTENIWLEKI